MTAPEAAGAIARVALERFFDLVAARDRAVLQEFAAGDAVHLVGSDAGEIAAGRQELEAFFTRIFAKEARFSFAADRVDGWQAGDLVWFFAEGVMVVAQAGAEERRPYRITGVLEQEEGRWRWRHYHGAEPVG